MRKPLIILTGPTAVGKTELSVALAGSIGAEIISADSMQVYRHMDIGSAKVTKEEMQGVRHHLIDCLNPDEPFHVAAFQQMAKNAMNDIYSRGGIPLMAGGTGFYIQSVLYDIEFTDQNEDPVYRQALEAEGYAPGGAAVLFARLKELDPESADAIPMENVKRVIRALEYYHLTGQKISAHNKEQRQRQSPYNSFYFVLNRDRSVLYERINRRVDLMMENGLLDEVRKLRNMGYTRDSVSMQGIGYKELLAYLDGETTLSEAVDEIKLNTRHFAKRQLTWFRRERDVLWLNADDKSTADLLAEIGEILKNNQEYIEYVNRSSL